MRFLKVLHHELGVYDLLTQQKGKVLRIISISMMNNGHLSF